MAEPKDRMMEIAPTSYLRVDGASIVDGSGTPVRLQGHCLGGWMNMENFITGYPATETLHRRALLKAMGPVAYEAFFDQFLTDFFSDSDAAYLADLGTNAMRIPISYRHFESDERPKVLIEAGLKWLDRAVNTLAAHRIYSIIDLHAAPGFQNHHWHSDNPTHWPLFWEYADFKERAIWLWEVLADHFKGNGWIAGFNLLNEPADQDGNRLLAWYSETARRVRDIDPDRMLFLDGNRYSTDFSMFTEPLANTVYTAHDYVMAGLDPHGHYPGELDGRYPGSAKGEVYNKDTIHEQFLRRTSFMRNLGLPIWIGEFGPLYNGTPQQAEERYQLLHDQLDIYRDYSASWALWLYRTSDCRAWSSRQLIVPICRYSPISWRRKSDSALTLGWHRRADPGRRRAVRGAARPRVSRLQPLPLGGTKVGRAVAAPYPHLRSAGTGIRRAVPRDHPA
jgi:endoglucanase